MSSAANTLRNTVCRITNVQLGQTLVRALVQHAVGIKNSR